MYKYLVAQNEHGPSFTPPPNSAPQLKFFCSQLSFQQSLEWLVIFQCHPFWLCMSMQVKSNLCATLNFFNYSFLFITFYFWLFLAEFLCLWHMLKIKSRSKILIPKQNDNCKHGKTDESSSKDFVWKGGRADVQVLVARAGHQGYVDPLQGWVHPAEGGPACCKGSGHQWAVDEHHSRGGSWGTTSIRKQE